MDTDKKQPEIKEEELIKTLMCKLEANGDLEARTNMPLSPEEALYMIVHLEIFCCDNLGIHPLVFHTELQNMLLNFILSNDEDIEKIEDNLDYEYEDLEEFLEAEEHKLVN